MAAVVRVGVGVNSGSLMLGTIGGRRRMDGTVISDAVNVAARVEQLTKTYELPLLITEFTRAQLVRDHDLREIDRVVVRGRSRPVVIYEVFDADAPTLRARKREALPAFARALALHRAGDHDAAREGFLAFLARVPDDRTAQVYVERCERGEGDQQRARSSDP